MKLISTIFLVLMLSGCGFFGGGKKDNVLVTSECPDSLGELSDSSFAATTKKLKEVADQYYLCKKAATATK